jgi:hypothetical protein
MARLAWCQLQSSGCCACLTEIGRDAPLGKYTCQSNLCASDSLAAHYGERGARRQGMAASQPSAGVADPRWETKLHNQPSDQHIDDLYSWVFFAERPDMHRTGAGAPIKESVLVRCPYSNRRSQWNGLNIRFQAADGERGMPREGRVLAMTSCGRCRSRPATSRATVD